MQYAVQFDYTNLYTLTFVYVHSQHRRIWHCVQGTSRSDELACWTRAIQNCSSKNIERYVYTVTQQYIQNVLAKLCGLIHLKISTIMVL